MDSLGIAIGVGVILILIGIFICVSIVKLGTRIFKIEQYLGYLSKEVGYMKVSMKSSGSIPFESGDPLTKHDIFVIEEEE
tara:strand:- start:9650 stop:9889 length:240 start_codon:yes stop_codon:yes gene_type:complete